MAWFLDKVHRLHERVSDFSSILAGRISQEINQKSLSEIKQELSLSKSSYLKVKSKQRGTVQGTLQIHSDDAYLLIDELLDQHEKKLQYTLTNFELKVNHEFVYGLVYENNGASSIHKVILDYNPVTKECQVNIDLNQGSTYRVLIMIPLMFHEYVIHEIPNHHHQEGEMSR